MTRSALSLILVLSSVSSAQTTDTLTVKYSESKHDSTLYRRIVQYDPSMLTYHLTDICPSAQFALAGDNVSINPTVKALNIAQS